MEQTEIPEINPQIHETLIVTKVPRPFYRGRQSFQQMVLEQLNIHMQRGKKDFDPHVVPS